MVFGLRNKAQNTQSLKFELLYGAEHFYSIVEALDTKYFLTEVNITLFYLVALCTTPYKQRPHD